ncbi:hypothetical protein ACIG54_07705 [Streptomyces achromogenes]|uniref:hypothetical protein n=1 Tax=Streptomyces achromogenes TaxID=67255 RepID=UPI0037D97A2F
MTGGELTLGAVLVRLEEREREITVQTDVTRKQIAQLTARLDELSRAAEELQITRKTLLELPGRQPPAPPARSCRTIRPTSRSWRRSPRPAHRCGRGRYAR